MNASLVSVSRNDSPDLEPVSPVEDTTNLADEERGLARPSQLVPLAVRSHPSSDSSHEDDETELRTRPNSINSASGYIKRKTSQLFSAVSGSTAVASEAIAPRLAALVDAYSRSSIASDIKTEIDVIQREQQGRANGSNSDELPDVALETSLLRGRKRASWGTQFRILSGRAFKNLYRDPALLAAHYLASIALARKSYFLAGYRFLCRRWLQ